MPVVEATTSVHRSINDVYAFVRDQANHAVVLPPGWSNFALLTPVSDGAGASSSFDIQLAGQTLHVQVVVIEDDAPRRYVEQCYSRMEHVRTWLFESIVDRTRLRLTLEYVPQPGFWGRLSDRTVIQPALRRALVAYLENVKQLLERGRGNVETQPGRWQ